MSPPVGGGAHPGGRPRAGSAPEALGNQSDTGFSTGSAGPVPASATAALRQVGDQHAKCHLFVNKHRLFPVKAEAKDEVQKKAETVFAKLKSYIEHNHANTGVGKRKENSLTVSLTGSYFSFKDDEGNIQRHDLDLSDETLKGIVGEGLGIFGDVDKSYIGAQPIGLHAKHGRLLSTIDKNNVRPFDNNPLAKHLPRDFPSYMAHGLTCLEGKDKKVQEQALTRLVMAEHIRGRASHKVKEKINEFSSDIEGKKQSIEQFEESLKQLPEENRESSTLNQQIDKLKQEIQDLEKKIQSLQQLAYALGEGSNQFAVNTALVRFAGGPDKNSNQVLHEAFDDQKEEIYQDMIAQANTSAKQSAGLLGKAKGLISGDPVKDSEELKAQTKDYLADIGMLATDSHANASAHLKSAIGTSYKERLPSIEHEMITHMIYRMESHIIKREKEGIQPTEGDFAQINQDLQKCGRAFIAELLGGSDDAAEIADEIVEYVSRGLCEEYKGTKDNLQIEADKDGQFQPGSELLAQVEEAAKFDPETVPKKPDLQLREGGSSGSDTGSIVSEPHSIIIEDDDSDDDDIRGGPSS